MKRLLPGFAMICTCLAFYQCSTEENLSQVKSWDNVYEMEQCPDGVHWLVTCRDMRRERRTTENLMNNNVCHLNSLTITERSGTFLGHSSGGDNCFLPGFTTFKLRYHYPHSEGMSRVSFGEPIPNCNRSYGLVLDDHVLFPIPPSYPKTAPVPFDVISCE